MSVCRTVSHTPVITTSMSIFRFDILLTFFWNVHPSFTCFSFTSIPRLFLVFSIPIRGIFCQKQAKGMWPPPLPMQKRSRVRSQIKRLTYPLYVWRGSAACHDRHPAPRTCTYLLPSFQLHVEPSLKAQGKGNEASTPAQHRCRLSPVSRLSRVTVAACSLFRPVSSEFWL